MMLVIGYEIEKKKKKLLNENWKKPAVLVGAHLVALPIATLTHIV